MSNPTAVSDIERKEHDPVYGIKKVSPYETDGANAVPPTSKQVAMKVTTSGANTYVAIAPIGTAQSDNKWQCKKIAVSGNDTVITWAGGGAFNQVATDLTALTYA